MFKKQKITWLIIVLCLLFVFTASGCRQPIITELGIPSLSRFETGTLARCVWDIKYWNGTVYVGGGDYGENTGPTDLWAYDVQAKEWNSSGSLDSEAITRFNVINDKLIAPGIDPMGGWNVGNYYELDENGWQEKNVLPAAVHNFDIVEYNGDIIAGTGCEGHDYPALISHDDGKTFKTIRFYKNGKLYDIEQYDYSRTYELFAFKEELYGLVYHKNFDGTYLFELFRLDGETFVFVKNADSFLNVSITSLNILNSKAQFNDNFFISSDYLYVSSDLNEFTKVDLPNGEFASQFKIIDNTFYLLCFKQNTDAEKPPFSITMYRSRNGINRFKKVFSLDYEVPPICFDKNGNNFYLGMGSMHDVHDLNGMVLEVLV